MGLKKNIAYKGLLTFSNYIIGFVTFPYITRVLGPENFGLVNFALNTVDYFLLFATMGIATIGTREIAAARNNKAKLDSAFSKILGVNLTFTIITLLIYFLSILLIPKLYENRELLYVGSAKIIFTAFAVEWFFTGIENFRYITYRSLAIKLLYVVSVFILVKNQSDYKLYFLLTILSIVLNSIINFIYARKFVSWDIREAVSKNYIKQNLRLGVYAIMSSMYITFNVVYLGLVSTDAEVGYYSTAVKLYFIAVSLFGAFTQVMMPRVSSLLSNGNNQAVSHYLHKSFILVFMTAFPIIIFSEFFAPVIINIMSGPEYESSVTPMRVLMPALFLVWIAQVIALQALIPMRKDNILLIASLAGGIGAIIVNILITPKLASLGSAITLLICESIVTAICLLVCKIKHLIILPSLNFVLIYLLKSLPYFIICMGIIQWDNGQKGAIIAFALGTLYFIFQRPLQILRS